MSRTARVLVVIIGIIVLIAAVAGIAAFTFFGIGRGFAVGYRGFGPGIFRILPFPFGGGIITLLLTALVIGSIIWLVLSLARGGDQTRISTPVNETPLDILKRRYAKGEITKEQYDQMKQDLGV
jgi:putative membrane protein